MATNDYILVAAIDFGTTYSGCAFQMSSEYNQDDPTQRILTPQAWNEGTTRLTSLKTPTCLLLDCNQDIDSFGYVAEDRYANLCMDGDNKNFYYFRRFKMKLHDTTGLKKTTELTDESGKQLPALTVFSRSIECLKIHLYQMLEKKRITVKDGEVHWVLTVPAIWNDTAKGFMREAAKKAGLPSAHLTIALEPEAASLFCQYLPVEKFSVGGTVGFSDAKPGTTYMIVDLGGGTADITVHEKVSSGKLKEVHRASGGPWGGTRVDAEFLKLLSDIVGGPVMAIFMKEQMYDYLEMMRDFEGVKRVVSLTATEPIKLKIPVSLNDTCQKAVKRTFKELVKMAKKDKLITFVGDKAKFDAELMKGLFKKTADKIVSHMKGILTGDASGKRVSLILMVGGFSESAYIQDVVKKEFHEKNDRRVLIPKDAGISVVQGAVVYGRQPGNITSRILRFTYGAKLNEPFVKGKHDLSRQMQILGDDFCRGCFGKFIGVGTQVTVGHEVKKSYKTHPDSSCTQIEVFVSDEQDVMYADDSSCRSLGSLLVDITSAKNEKRDLDVVYVFGNTELFVKATDVKSGKPCEANLKMLE